MELPLNKDPIISASEIRDFVFCPMSFLLKRAGCELESYKPKTLDEEKTIKKQIELISAGKVVHEKIAEKVEKIFKQEKLAKESSNIGILILIIGIIFAILLLFLI